MWRQLAGQEQMVMTQSRSEHRGEETTGEPKGEVSYRCRFCGKSWPLSDMRMVRRFSPPVLACQYCESKMR
jgi:DNA-directed RNA polymerase subunit RPC12/RpoP